MEQTAADLIARNYNTFEEAIAELESKIAAIQPRLGHPDSASRSIIPTLQHKDDHTSPQNTRPLHLPQKTLPHLEYAHGEQISQISNPVHLNKSYILSVLDSPPAPLSAYTNGYCHALDTCLTDKQKQIQATDKAFCATEGISALHQTLISEPSTQLTPPDLSPDLVLLYRPYRQGSRDAGYSSPTCSQGKHTEDSSVPSIVQGAKIDLVLLNHWETKLGLRVK